MIDTFEWTGDLEDDCVCRWNGYVAHAEQMGKRDWYCSVSLAPQLGEVNGPPVFCATESDIRPLTGPAARRLCELVMERESRHHRAIGNQHMSRMFQIYEDDLSKLEHILPELAMAMTPHLDNRLRTQLRQVQAILSNVRWDYGPPTDVEVIPVE